MSESPSDRGTGWITLERDYRATPEEVWALWTTKGGIESWWGPEGFAVTVQQLDLRAGGELRYTMTATGPGQMEFMRQSGMPLATEVSLVYTEVQLLWRLSYTMSTDFVPGVEPYESTVRVSFAPDGDGVHMVLSFSPMHDDEWTQRSRLGHESELDRLEAILRGKA
jgi:uncharacterized protein YndB with AHSA1/START domain